MMRLYPFRYAACVLAAILSFPCHSRDGFRKSRRTYLTTPSELTDSCLRFPLSERPVRTTIEVRAAIAGVGERRGMAPCFWGLNLVNGNDTLRLTLRYGNSDFGDILDRRQTFVSLSEGNSILKSIDAKGFENSSGTFNTLSLSYDLADMTLKVGGGGRKRTQLFELKNLPFIPDSFELWSKGKLTVSSLATEQQFDPRKELTVDYSFEELKKRIEESTDPAEAFWEYLDRENDPRYARPGGRYVLATLKNDETGFYDIIYISGAETYADRWAGMMKKGALMPTIFENHFDLQWIDSEFVSIDRDTHADIVEEAILSLSFPLLKTTLRFSRLLKAPDYKERESD